MFKRLIVMLTAAALTAAMSVSAFAEPEDGLDHAVEDTTSASGGEGYISAYISDSYNEEFDTYEVIVCDQIAFYTNVENGGITADPVVIDFPAGVDMSLEKDGVPISFTNKKPITEYGSYSMTILINGEELVGGSPDETYYAIYRFRIQEKPAGSVDSETEEAVDDTPADTDTSDDELPDQTGDETAPDEQQGDTTTAGDGSAAGTDTPEEQQPVAEGDTSLITETFDSSRVNFVTKAGTEFTCNIPNGFKTTSSVDLRLLSDVKHELYRDGVLTEFVTTNKIAMTGKYRLLIYDGSGKLPAEFNFEILNKYVSGMEKYEVPKGCEITMALLDGEQVRSSARSVDLGAEGLYTINISAGDLIINENLTLDNTPPEFALDRVNDGVAYGGTVTLMFMSDDIESYDILFEGEPFTGRGTKMTEPGDYTITVYDRAGNSSTQSFELEYRMNTTAIMVVVIGGIIVIAAIVFIVYSRKKFIIR